MELKKNDWVRIKDKKIFYSRLKVGDVGQVKIADEISVIDFFKNGARNQMCSNSSADKYLEKIIKPVKIEDLKIGMKVRFKKDNVNGKEYENLTWLKTFFDLNKDYTINKIEASLNNILAGDYWVGLSTIDYAICQEAQDKEEQKTAYCLDDFKVGQQVKIRKDLKVGKRYGNDTVITDMSKFFGEIVTIRSVNSLGFRIEGSFFNWTPEMVETIISQPQMAEKEPAKSTDNMRVEFSGSATILYKYGKKYVAKCDKDEKFDKEKGLYVCLAKAAGYKFDDIQKLLDNAQEIKKPITKIKGSKIKLGSTVRVVDSGKCYPSYSDWFLENNQHKLGTHFVKFASLGEHLDKLFKVVAIGKHRLFCGKITICAIQPVDGKQVYLIDVEGLKLA